MLEGDAMDRLLDKSKILSTSTYNDLPSHLRPRRAIKKGTRRPLARSHRGAVRDYGAVSVPINVVITWTDSIGQFVIRVSTAQFILTNSTMIVQVIVAIDRLDCPRHELNDRVMEIVAMWNRFDGRAAGEASSRNNVTLCFS